MSSEALVTAVAVGVFGLLASGRFPMQLGRSALGGPVTAVVDA